MHIALLQLNLQPGAPEWNSAHIRRAVNGAVIAAEGAPLLCVTPELALSGAPLESLAELAPFMERCSEHMHALAVHLTSGPPLLLGVPEHVGGCAQSAVYLLHKGHARRVATRPLADALLYGPSRRLAAPMTAASVELEHGSFAVVLGGSLTRTSPLSPATDGLIVMDTEPFEPGSWCELEPNMTALALTVGKPVFRVNPIGGSGSWIFPGGSVSVDAQGRIRTRACSWKQELLLESFAELTAEPTCVIEPSSSNHLDAIWHTLVLGVRDYAKKNGFQRIVLGLSGGMDSSIVAALAVEAIGANNVTGLLMPSPWSSQGSLDDATALAKNLGIVTHTIPISPLMDAFDTALAPLFIDKEHDVTEENLQARIRGSLLMAYANKFAALLLNTTNKSEAAMGYGTLYGDLAGGLSPLLDVYKTDAYRLAAHYNALQCREVIPQNVFDKAPSAELRPGQTDQDSLPPYDNLDEALRTIIEGRTLPSHALCPALDAQALENVARRLRGSEFKRQQAPLGLFVSAMPFALMKLPLPTPAL